MDDLIIKKINIDDVYQLQEISRKTFFETFSETNTAEDMATYLNENLSLDRLIAELGNDDSEFYFAIEGDSVLGYLKLNSGRAQTELMNDNSLEIERIYVLKEFHSKHVGQLLYTKALEIATNMGATYVWLGVWEKNLRAIRFYKKNGFTEFDKHIFRLGSDEQTDILMRRKVKDCL